MAAPALSRTLGILRLALGVALIWYVVAELGPSTLERVRATTWWLLPAMAVLPFFGAVVEAVRLRLLFGALGMPFSAWMIYRVALMGAFFNVCIPGITTGGDVMRVFFFAANRPRSTVEILAVLLVDRAVSLLGLLTVVLVLALPYASSLWQHEIFGWLLLGVLLVMALVVLAGAIACSKTLREHPWRNGLLRRLPLGHFAQRFLDAVYAYRDQRRALVLAWLVCLPGHLALAAMFFLAAGVFLPGCETLLAGMTSLLAMLANVLPLTPGGLGVGELAFDRLFEALGHAGGASLQLAWRAAMLPIILAGGVLYALGKWKQRRGAAAS